jgi:hypothetical protein
MKMSRALVIFFSFLSGCSQLDTIEKKVANKIDDCVQPCLIVLKDQTSFDWDKVYIFGVPATLEEINDAIGIPYSKYEEFTRPLIFVKGNEIVYSENNPSDIEGIMDGQLVFGNATDTIKYNLFTSENAVFEVRKRKSKSKTYYELIQNQ